MIRMAGIRELLLSIHRKAACRIERHAARF
jgi:hypothetical protein